VVAGLAFAVAGVALWITLHARFLAHPGWLAVQKADFILGPIGVGLYWRHRRPRNRLGVMLIVLGLLGVPYVLESTSSQWPFTVGTLFEYVIEPMTVAVILAFPSGRLDGRAERVILAIAFFGIPLFGLLFALIAPQYTPAYSLSGCRALCPSNPLVVWPAADWGAQVTDACRATLVAVYFGAAALLAWRFVSGTAPQRRALAIGGPIAMCFLVTLGVYQVLSLANPGYAAANAEPFGGAIGWVGAASRSAIWYGFLFALIAAELFAGAVLRDVVRRSLGRPSLRELEGMLRRPLGDPGLRLGFWRAGTRDWVGHDGSVMEPPKRGQALTEVARDGRPAAAIVHDTQLAEDPELLQAAGAAALLAQENAELEAAWRQSIGQLADSRARLASTAERERRKLERDLHDGAQQRLVAATINLTLADEAGEKVELHRRIADAREEIEQALGELREIAHGLYPTALARAGLGHAFEWLAGRYQGNLVLTEAAVGRFSPEIELAVYYCGLEAVQNASKHAGRGARISIRLYTEADHLHLEVRDNGVGFEVARARDSHGLQNMRDRLGAVGGRVDVVSKAGQGTLVAISVPVIETSAGEIRAVGSPRAEKLGVDPNTGVGPVPTA
jgi:signal transduction histidine kinase